MAAVPTWRSPLQPLTVLPAQHTGRLLFSITPPEGAPTYNIVKGNINRYPAQAICVVTDEYTEYDRQSSERCRDQYRQYAGFGDPYPPDIRFDASNVTHHFAGPTPPPPGSMLGANTALPTPCKFHFTQMAVLRQYIHLPNL
jgi:hypothetical protein